MSAQPSKYASPDVLRHYVLDRARALPEDCRSLVIGYSGGLDSSVLLDVMAWVANQRSIHLSAIHVHHGLSPHADAWVAHCEAQASRYGLSIRIEKGEVRTRGEGIEAAARQLRQSAFQSCAPATIVLAHHSDDQAETLLYRLVRGTGVRGAGAIAEWHRTHTQVIWRPLLEIPRSALEGYARALGLSWIEDESNQCDDFDRNYLRQHVLPAIDRRFPSGKRNLVRAAKQFSEAAALLDELAGADAGPWQTGLNLSALRQLSAARQRNVLRYVLGECGVQAAEKHIDLVLQQFLGAGEDRIPMLRLGEHAVHRYRDRLYIVPWVQSVPQGQDVSPAIGEARRPVGWFGMLRWQPVPTGGIDPAHSGLRVYSRRQGLSMRLWAGGPTKQMKQLFQEAGIPPWLREQWPMIFRGDELVAIPGIGVASQFQSASGQVGWLPIWTPDGMAAVFGQSTD
ncbi:tRNA lysidine(34) synthetase TilS [Burkholderiaceae bacterium DAT-1]|nr:tRNA lysidine(34) synthetase TilS [Burkholderiaceae bacterium DAT-1]